MPRSGPNYSLPEPSFIPLTPISSAAMNSDLDDIADALTASLARNGAGGMTAVLPLDNDGFVYITDTNTGMHRLSADTQAIFAGGTNIVTINPTSVTITGAVSITGSLLAPDGTVLLPAYSWASDPDSGLYRIGANNIGVAVNAAKVLDIGVTGLNVIGTVSTNGTVIPPAAYAAGMINGTIVESNAGNAVTFALKTLAGTDPSATDPVLFLFRSATAGAGTYSAVSVTAALSITIASGSAIGASNGTAFRVWLVAFNDSGTVRLAAINCRSGTNIYPLGVLEINSAASGAAPSAQLFYTGTGGATVTTKSYVTIAYATYDAGLATAGTWNVSPTRLSLVNADTPMPGRPVQPVGNETGAVATGSTQIPDDDSIPQIGEGDQYLSQAITPTSAANVLEQNALLHLTSSNTTVMCAALFQDAGANAISAGRTAVNQTDAIFQMKIQHKSLAGTTSATTFTVRAGLGASGTVTFNGVSGARKLGGVLCSQITVTEVMA